MNKTLDDYRGKLCPTCSAIQGYTPHAPWCGYYRPGLIGNMIGVSNPGITDDTIGMQVAKLEAFRADFVATRAGASAWENIAKELQFDILVSNDYDRALLAGMKIALNNGYHA